MEKQTMRLQDDREEIQNGMALDLLADEPGEAEAAMLLNALVDDADALNREAEMMVDALEGEDG